METVLIVIHLMVVIAMIVVVLLQRSEGGALGIGGGGGGGFMTARGSANVLTRATAILATVFLITSVALAIIARSQGEPSSILDATGAPAASQPAGEGGEGTEGGATGQGNGILDTLQRQSPQQSDEPQVPTSE